jgi:hypothetical protein
MNSSVKIAKGDGDVSGSDANTYKYEEVIFDSCNYDAITSYPSLQMESRRVFYSKLFNIMSLKRYRY